MLRAYKYRIYPTDEQKVLFAKTFGCCRFVYNWALNLKITAYKERKEMLGNVYLTNLMKSELKVEHEWLSEVNSQSLQRSLDRLKLLQKRLSRKQKGSANRNKARIRVARLQEHIANSRKDSLHKITHALTHDSQVRTICMEDLNVKGMQRNHHLAQAVGDASFGMFLTLLEYKCSWYGVNLIKIDRFAPSSKTCGKCGHVYKGLNLSERSWTCPECGTHHDRDFNVACNIKEFGLKALPTERGKVKPVDCPLVDDRPRVLKSNGRKKQEKRGGIGISEAAKSLV
ncbi:RNA-guided endonuclease TnpB family protein [Phocaeicola coprophilus]